jgi:hypothetical protein
MNILKYEDIEKKIIEIRGEKVLLDSDVATIYGVETKRINEAVKNNINKFPDGYIFELNNEDWQLLRSKISTLETIGKGKHVKYLPKAFTEKGLYMLATILKSPQATEATITIIETFAKIRQLTKTIKDLSTLQDKDYRNTLMQKSGEFFSEILDDSFETTGMETSIEINFAIMKFKHTLKKDRKH